MSLKTVKTIGYDFFVDHLLWALDLYDSNNRNSRLKEKRSYSSKQTVYVDELHENLILALCDQSRDVTVLVNGLLDFSEVAASFVLSKSVVTSLSKEQLYQRYAKHILCPLLIAYMEIFTEFHDHSPFMRHLDTLLLSTQEEGVAHAARKLLLSMLKAPECESYRDELTEFIRDIRSDRTQRRATIEQKIQLAMSTCSKIKSSEKKQQCLRPLAILQEAYTVCMAVIYFDIQTGLGRQLAMLYQRASLGRTRHSDIRINSLSSSIVKFIKVQQHAGNVLSKEAREHLDKLWGMATKNVPQISNLSINQNINTLFYLLGHAGYSVSRITDYKKSEKFFQRVSTQDNLHYLKPYALVLQVLYHVKNGHLQAALDLIESGDACLLDNVVGPLPYYLAIFYIGLTIKISSLKIKNGYFNPLIQLIINTQELYVDVRLNSAELLSMSFESFISDSYSHAILRSIREYNIIIATHLSDINGCSHLSIFDAWEGVELLLRKVSSKLVDIPPSDYVGAIAKALTKSDKESILITYLPNSTLYHCVRELEGLLSYLSISTKNHPHTHLLLQDIEYRKAVLMALDPEQYEKDTMHQLE